MSGSRIGRTIADSTPHWPAPVSPPRGAPNILVVLFDDVGRDRGSPVSDYAAPFPFTGTLRRVTVTMDGDQSLDGDGIGRAEMARQ
jgi:hypothetical protein